VATEADLVSDWRRRNASALKKKKVRSFPLYSFGMMSGPEKLPPNSLRLYLGLGRCVAKKFFAAITRLR